MAVQGDTGVLRSHWHREVNPSFMTRVGAPLQRTNGGLLWEAARHSQALFVDDYAGQSGHRTDLAQAGGRSVVSVGLGHDGPVSYVMTLARIGRVQPWTGRDRQIVQAVIQVVRQSVTQAAGRAALREKQAQLHLALDAAPVVLWACDMAGRFTLSEGRGLERLGLRGGEVVGQLAREIYAGMPELLGHLDRALAGERFTTQVTVGDGLFEARYVPMLNDDGLQVGVVGTGYDVTTTVQAQLDAVRAREQAEALLDLSRVLEADTAPAGATRTALQTIGRLIPGGWSTLWQRVAGDFVPLAEGGEVPAGIDGPAARAYCARILDASGVLTGTTVVLAHTHLTVEARHADLRGAALLPVLLDAPEPLVLAVYRAGDGDGWTALEQDLLAAAARILGAAAGRRRRLEQMEEEARTDTLTGLGNRRAFELDLDAELSRARRQGSTVGVLSIDLDGLKRVNDTWGHARGDALLRDFARDLRQELRAGDRVHRLGGDEYAVVLPGVGEADGLLSRVRAAVEATRALGYTDMDASAGLACFPADAQDAAGLTQLSDARMYADKARKQELTRTADTALTRD